MTAATPTSAPARRRFRSFFPRYSLRMLLIVVTAAGVAAAIWWRWPVTVTIARLEESPMDGETYQIYETTTYHRGMFGNLIRHGVNRRMQDNQLWLECHCREEKGVLIIEPMPKETPNPLKEATP